MSKMNVFETMQQIYRDIFDDEELQITREMTNIDIEEWDSLTHINIIASCESAFKIKFDIEEIVSIRNIGDIIDIVEKKLTK